MVRLRGVRLSCGMLGLIRLLGQRETHYENLGHVRFNSYVVHAT